MPEHMYRVDTEDVEGRREVGGDRLGVVRAGKVPTAAVAAEVRRQESVGFGQHWRQETKHVSRGE
jgi:hypothetical protein